jgi:hypothetical protein
MLKQGIDALSGKSSFKDGWSLLGVRFPNLMDYYGVVATLFLGTSTVELDFSVLRWEKDKYSKALLDWKVSYNQSSTSSFNNSFIKVPILPTQPIA